MMIYNSKFIAGLVQNRAIRWFLSTLSILSFILANLIIFIVMSRFLVFSINPLFLFFSGLVVSFLLIKTHLFISTKKKAEEKEKDTSGKTWIDQISSIKKKVKIGIWNVFLVITRLLFFNVLNDLFMVLIVWCGILGVYCFAGFIKVTAIQDLTGVLTIMGILLGLFQFYIKFYRDQVYQRMLNNIVKYFTEISKKLTFSNFLKYIEQNHQNFYEKINSELRVNPAYPILKIFKDERIRGGKEITNITLNIYPTSDILLSQLLELSRIGKNELKKIYKEFFELKSKEIKNEIDRLDLVELRKLILPNIMFFDEVMSEIANMMYLSESNKEPESYQEFLQLTIYESVVYLIERIIGMEDEI